MIKQITTVDFSGVFIGEVVKLDETSRELAVNIYKMTPMIPRGEYTYSEPTIKKDIVISETVSSPSVSLCNYIWVKPMFYKDRLPTVGSKVLVLFVDQDPSKGIWRPFGIDSTQYDYYEKEKYLGLFNIQSTNERSHNVNGASLITKGIELLEQDLFLLNFGGGVKGVAKADPVNKTLSIDVTLNNVYVSESEPDPVTENLLWVNGKTGVTQVYCDKAWHTVVPEVANYAHDSERLAGKLGLEYSLISHTHDYVSVTEPVVKGNIDCTDHEVQNIICTDKTAGSSSASKSYVDSNFPKLVEGLIPKRYLPPSITEDYFCDIDLTGVADDYIANIVVPKITIKNYVELTVNSAAVKYYVTIAADGKYAYTVSDAHTTANPLYNGDTLNLTVQSESVNLVSDVLGYENDVITLFPNIDVRTQGVSQIDQWVPDRLKRIIIDNFSNTSTRTPNAQIRNKIRIYSFLPKKHRGFYDLVNIKLNYEENPFGNIYRLKTNKNMFIDTTGSTLFESVASSGPKDFFVNESFAIKADKSTYYLKTLENKYYQMHSTVYNTCSCKVIKPGGDINGVYALAASESSMGNLEVWPLLYTRYADIYGSYYEATDAEKNSFFKDAPDRETRLKEWAINSILIVNQSYTIRLDLSLGELNKDYTLVSPTEAKIVASRVMPITKHIMSYKKSNQSGTWSGEDIPNEDVQYNETTTLPECPYSLTGYKFIGWETGGEVYAADATFTVTSDAMFTTIFVVEAETYTGNIRDKNTPVINLLVDKYLVLPVETVGTKKTAVLTVSTDTFMKPITGTTDEYIKTSELYFRYSSDNLLTVGYCPCQGLKSLRAIQQPLLDTDTTADRVGFIKAGDDYIMYNSAYLSNGVWNSVWAEKSSIDLSMRYAESAANHKVRLDKVEGAGKHPMENGLDYLLEQIKSKP